tara:strand:- start:118 stop:333 length:216 start_codon:yes stop_codon:yes gene_type:complete
MSAVTFNGIERTFNSLTSSFTNVILGAVLFGTKTIKVSKAPSPILTRVKMPVSPVITRVAVSEAPVYTRIM